MNLATMTLALYLKNPAHRSIDDNPMMTLPNGKRIEIITIEYEVTTLSDTRARFVTTYQVKRLIGSRDRCNLGSCADIESLAKLIADESR